MVLDSDRLFLRASVALAERGLNSATPNPRVGCLIVRDGEVLGRGWHVRPGEGHAEVNALSDAQAKDVRGATVYVSLEPCAFEGRTPACSQTLIAAGVARVVAAMTDPHPLVGGRGFADLQSAGIEVDLVELPEALALNEGYVSRVTRNRPFVRLKVAASMDARTAMASGESQWITSKAARADVQRWRARSCAVLTGSGTVLADNPKLTVRDQTLSVEGNVRQPRRVVVDGGLRVPPESAIFDSSSETLIAHARKDAAPIEGAEHLSLPGEAGRVSLSALLAELAERDCNEVLVEAGPGLVGAFLQQGLWDELLLYLAPRFFGHDARPLAYLGLERMAQAIETTIVDHAMVGEDLRLRLRAETTGSI